MEWISVDDRLPGKNDGDEAIVYDGKYVLCARINGGMYTFADMYISSDGTEWDIEGVTHWMPPPSPPEAT